MPPETLGDIAIGCQPSWQELFLLDTRTDTETNRCESEIDFVVGDGSLQSILEESTMK